jgi:putative two-component system response regulator
MDLGMKDMATILVVDDAPENIDVLVGILKPSYQLKVARDGEMAIKIANIRPRPDLILLDVMMPGIDGYETCKRLKLDLVTRDIPIIFVTAKISVEDEARGLSLGAVDYIAKPVTPAIVMQRVRTHLALSDQKRELYQQVKLQTKELINTRNNIIQKLGRAAEFKDNETGDHVQRMSKYAYVLAIAYGMDEAAADMLMSAAPMHDVGKIGVPDHILKKAGQLNNDEWQLMKEHASFGGVILDEEDPSPLMEMAKAVAITHHEKWDGSGYPKGLIAEEIPLVGRIIAIADVFDALTSKRPYKPAWTIERAIELIQNESGKHFDPELVVCFTDSLDKVLAIKAQFSE